VKQKKCLIKTELIVIRCTPETKQRFRLFAAYFDNFEEALKALLDLADRYWRKPIVFRQ